MTAVTILPERSTDGTLWFRAVSGQEQTKGATAGEALDALGARLSPPDFELIALVQEFRPDAFFTLEQQRRLEELMGVWREARDRGAQLPPNEQQELDSLIAAELRGATERARAIAAEIKE